MPKTNAAQQMQQHVMEWTAQQFHQSDTLLSQPGEKMRHASTAIQTVEEHIFHANISQLDYDK